MGGIKSCAILGHDPMRFAWGFDEEADECRELKLELLQQIIVLAIYDPASARGDNTDAAIQYAQELQHPMRFKHPDSRETAYAVTKD